MALFDDSDKQIWFDGVMEKWQDAKIPITSHAIHYATTVWDGLRVYDGNIFELRKHAERLFAAAVEIGMTKYSQHQIEQAIIESVEGQNIKNGYVRPLLWRGPNQFSVNAVLASTHFAVISSEIPSYYTASAANEGITLATATMKRPPPDTGKCLIKAAANYLPASLEKEEAERKGFNDALMLDWRGLVADVTAANIFLVMDGALHTPLADCFLAGITRQIAMDCAKARGIPTIERQILPGELIKADEVFVTGTAAEISPVRLIDDRPYKVGNVTRNLKADYAARTHAVSSPS